MNGQILSLAVSAGLMISLNSQVLACHLDGYIFCDVNQSGSIDAGDKPLGDFGYPNVWVNAVDSNGAVYSGYTNPDGSYIVPLVDSAASYTATLDLSTFPPDTTVVQPAGGHYSFSLDDTVYMVTRNWLVDAPVCHTQVADKCWLTGGGVKFSTITQSYLAEHGPQHNLGGNVFPSCDPNPGDGGQWNHVAHREKLHFLGTHIETVNCGNVPGIEPGSESPVTPYNFIEFRGTGRLTGIKGNKVDLDNVYFFARAEDRNEPGSNGAKDGADVDRYFIHVYSDPADPVGTTLLIVDEDGSADSVNPVTITGGNLQLHISSCDNPPAQ